MKLSISNIAWAAHQDDIIFDLLKKYHFSGLELAPTRILPEAPYSHMAFARTYAETLFETHHLEVASIQSIWYGKKENLFHSHSDRHTLFEYTQKAIDFASAMNCKNVVLGSPKNRNRSEDSLLKDDASDFFRQLGDYAFAHHTTLALEPNPSIYDTNFINITAQALEYIEYINSPGLRVNLDLGTMIANEEDIAIIAPNLKWINHIHISEPFLNPIQKRTLHNALISILKTQNYQGYVSIEMKKGETLEPVTQSIEYLASLF
ncbi:sugar phosphate isomerase/epimerase family protein [Fusibacter ferrireducens]|uniref:Sugar phosphate isomerase/epimerase n=1 Tax=Fusibacter ferrireducens TaxID=2785058 RepID=A0ABR9ZWJ7_9FIRM|nr:sugar phosphate isomerase/epimerase family protein [Fusibacter ferrireducens]MBF4694518.1 sugar phosphate isomerase/epimerase [Fusibacter ferrireducens]